MEQRAKVKKSTHLQKLEDVFEQRTRRFSPFEVLGLTRTPDSQTPGDERKDVASDTGQSTSSADIYPGSTRPTPPLGLVDPPLGLVDPPLGLVDPPPGLPPSGGDEKTNKPISPRLFKSTAKIDRPTPGSGRPTPGSGRPTRVVVVSTTTTKTDPPLGLVDPPPHSFVKPVEEVQKIEPLQLAEVVTASQLSGNLAEKIRQVLGYLNGIRSIEHNSYTMPVGYGQISAATGVDSDYLRRKVLPKLAMLGLIGVARKNLEGTVYYLQHSMDYLHIVAGEAVVEGKAAEPTSNAEETSKAVEKWPEWLDRQQWGWLSPESIHRLVEKAGSELQAREKLEVIVYNETHGPSGQRVRNRRSVLAHYLSSPHAELWPNDDGFETLTMKHARMERDRAQREKALTEETLRVRKEAQKAQFISSLSEGQIQWIKQEAKRLVDARPEAKMLSSRYPLYKAEEDRLLEEWMDKGGYGEVVPSAANSN
jgi:hypothetical protein